MQLLSWLMMKRVNSYTR